MTSTGGLKLKLISLLTKDFSLEVFVVKVAICGYLGSGCTEVAEILAGKFGLEIFNTSRILTMIKDFEPLSRSGEVDVDLIIKNKLEEILQQRDNIIIEGRSAFFLLDRKDVIKVFLNSSLEERIRHVASRRGIPLDEAREDVERSDRDRNGIVKRFFNKDEVTPEDFDFSIKTNAKTFAKVADIIADVIKGLSAMRP